MRVYLSLYIYIQGLESQQLGTSRKVWDAHMFLFYEMTQ